MDALTDGDGVRCLVCHAGPETAGALRAYGDDLFCVSEPECTARSVARCEAKAAAALAAAAAAEPTKNSAAPAVGENPVAGAAVPIITRGSAQ